MKRNTFLAVFFVSLALILAYAMPARAESGELFKKHKCAKCHTFKRIGMTDLVKYPDTAEEEDGEEEVDAPDLSTLSKNVEQTPDFLQKLLKKEAAFVAGKKMGKRHKRRFSGPDADLTAIVQALLKK